MRSAARLRPSRRAGAGATDAIATARHKFSLVNQPLRVFAFGQDQFVYNRSLLLLVSSCVSFSLCRLCPLATDELELHKKPEKVDRPAEIQTFRKPFSVIYIYVFVQTKGPPESETWETGQAQPKRAWRWPTCSCSDTLREC